MTGRAIQSLYYQLVHVEDVQTLHESLWLLMGSYKAEECVSYYNTPAIIEACFLNYVQTGKVTCVVRSRWM